MKTYALALLAIVALTSLGIFLVARNSVIPNGSPVITSPSRPSPPPAVPTLAPLGPIKETARIEAAKERLGTPAQTKLRPYAPGSTPSSAPIVGADAVNGDDPWAAEKATIQSLIADNNPGNVPAIARYLEHESAELRQEAVLGLLLLGEKSGAPFLIAATVKARTPEEAETFKEAAELLRKGVTDTTLPPPAPEPSNETSPSDLVH